MLNIAIIGAGGIAKSHVGSLQKIPNTRRKMMNKYRIGIVGCGGIARAHIEGYRTVVRDLCEVVAGCKLFSKKV